MLITNSSLVVPHNLIHNYKCALINKGFFKKNKQHINIKNRQYICKKKKKNTHKLKKIEKKII